MTDADNVDNLASDGKTQARPTVDDFKQQIVSVIPSLRAFARGLCRDRDQADDLTQEAMVRAWAARDSFTPGTNFRAWMFMIVRNLFYTHRRKGARTAVWDPEAAERILVQKPTQELNLHVRDLGEALGHLPDRQREILLLVAAEGLSYEEAAAVAGCTVGTVKSRLSRARDALAKLVGGFAESGARSAGHDA